MTRARSGLPMIGIYDFSYGPYALGDALTWTMNVNVRAAEAGTDAVDEYLVIDPARPGSGYQSFVNSHNYVSIIDNLFPAGGETLGHAESAVLASREWPVSPIANGQNRLVGVTESV